MDLFNGRASSLCALPGGIKGTIDRPVPGVALGAPNMIAWWPNPFM